MMIFCSLLIHLLFLVFSIKNRFLLFPRQAKPFPTSVEKRIEFELVDVPDDAAPLNDDEVKTPYRSDRSSAARDESRDDSLPVGEAMTAGRYRDVNQFDIGGTTQMPPPQNQHRLEEREEKEEIEKRSSERSVYQQEQDPPEQESLQKKPVPKQFINPFPNQFLHKQRTDLSKPDKSFRRHLESRASRSGSFSLNTYDWAWAEYIKEMKVKIEENLYFPVAFAQLGLINGEVFIRFKVLRNGHVSDIRVLRYRGHESLKQASLNSISSSHPFDPLPKDFPEEKEYLEITARFRYLN